jgi:lipid-binding SYLF domain-containing protein
MFRRTNLFCYLSQLRVLSSNSFFFFLQVGRLKPEKTIPDTILKQAKGLAIVTVAKVGMMVTYKIGTGLVVARKADGSWSPPSAISTCGIGYGAQVTSAVFFLNNCFSFLYMGDVLFYQINSIKQFKILLDFPNRLEVR